MSPGRARVGGAVAGVAFVDVGLADAFEGPCFLEWCAYGAGDVQCPGVAVAGLAAGRGLGQQLAEVVQRLGLAVAAADVAE